VALRARRAKIFAMLKYPRLILQAGPRILWDFTRFVWRYARHPERYPLEVRYARVRSLIVHVVNCLRVDWKVEGFETIRSLESKGQKYLLVADHESALDALAVVYWSAQPICFIAKKETRRMPFVGTAIKAMGGFFLDRGDLRQSFGIMKEVEKRLAAGVCSFIIFPEGTRNKDPETKGLAPFHPGSLKPALTAKTPIVPLAIYGTFRVFSPFRDMRRFPVELAYFPPIGPEEAIKEGTAALAPRLGTLISAKVSEFEKEDAAYFEAGFQKIPLRKGPVR
jgi:1-acyl-sn-glycerol-3-phosphate acyltransferase